MRKYLFLSCLLFSLANSPIFAITGDEIIDRVDQHENGYIDLKASIEMILSDRKGKQTIRLMDISSIESEKIGEKRKFIFRNPSDVNGTAILIDSKVIKDDSQWIYLPAFKRVKRISSKNKKSAFMGSQFSYEDLASQEKEKYKNEFVKESSIDNIPCLIVKRTPLLPNSGYDHILVYVDKTRHRFIKTEYFDKQGKMIKTLDISNYKLYRNRFLLASTYKVINHKTSKSTVMNWKNIILQNKLAKSDFSKNALIRSH